MLQIQRGSAKWLLPFADVLRNDALKKGFTYSFCEGTKRISARREELGRFLRRDILGNLKLEIS